MVDYLSREDFEKYVTLQRKETELLKLSDESHKNVFFGMIYGSGALIYGTMAVGSISYYLGRHSVNPAYMMERSTMIHIALETAGTLVTGVGFYFNIRSWINSKKKRASLEDEIARLSSGSSAIVE